MINLYLLQFSGEGLGKNGQGISSHIKVNRKDDVAGIGHLEKEVEVVGYEWWNDAYASALNTLKTIRYDNSENEKKKKRKRKRRDKVMENENEYKSDSDSSSEDEVNKISLQRDLSTYSVSDQELFRACKGRRLGKRSNVMQIGKMKREQLADKLFNETQTIEKVRKKKKKKKKLRKHKKSSETRNNN